MSKHRWHWDTRVGRFSRLEEDGHITHIWPEVMAENSFHLEQERDQLLAVINWIRANIPVTSEENETILWLQSVPHRF